MIEAKRNAWTKKREDDEAFRQYLLFELQLFVPGLFMGFVVANESVLNTD
jgi:hypothetical protein